MSWYGIDAVDKAFSRTRKALFEPFDLWKWAKLAIIVFLLGGVASNYGSSGTNYKIGSEDLENLPNIESGQIPGFPFDTHEIAFNYVHDASFPAIIIAAIVFIFLIVLIFSYISSIMEFVFVESLVRNEVKFWAYSQRFLGKGFYLLLVRLVLGLVFLAFFGIAIFPLIRNILKNSSDFAWPTLLGGIFWFAGVIIVLILIASAINSLLSLAIPLSIYRNKGILSAFGLVFTNFRKSWQEVMVYWFIRFVLGIGIAILAIFLFVLTVLVLGLVFLIFDAILYFLFSSMVSESLLWILLIPFIVIELILILGVLLFLNVPLAVFLKYHLLSFLEAWFVDAGIPFFDSPAQEPETALEPETGFNKPEPDF